jgi:hypothetical protein
MLGGAAHGVMMRCRCTVLQCRNWKAANPPQSNTIYNAEAERDAPPHAEDLTMMKLISRVAVLALAGTALAGCVYYPENGYYAGGGYYAPGPVVVAPAPVVVMGGGWGWGHGGGRGGGDGGWGHRR